MLSPSEDTAAPLSTVDRAAMRSLVCCLAHEKMLSDGSYGADPSKPKTVEVVTKVRSLLEEEENVKEDGTFFPTPLNDPLVQALGKPDQGGRVKGIGGINVGVKQSFGKVDRKERRLRSTEGLIT